MKFKSFFVALTLIFCILCLGGCDESEAEGALRRLKRAMNEVISIAVELDLLNDSHLTHTELAIETGFMKDSTGSLPKPVECEALLQDVVSIRSAHIDIIDTIAHLNLLKDKIEYLINKIRNNEALSAQLDIEYINQVIKSIQDETKALKDTIGGVFRVYRLKVEPHLGNVVAKAEELKTTFEGIISSLASRELSLKRVANHLIDIEYEFSIMVVQE
ncbi:MAG: hypothetical protein ACOX40_05760 [Bacilli bacterium]|jgi:hypothetical protein|nr:hypothetical protein [Acholeplasmataceae bacterium]